ncbi:MAG: universal stress protein [Rhizobiales bacterium]|nr:universal stress protein [Hyphomicrobiales bacterium]
MIKDITLKLETDPARDRSLDYAISVAQACDAHVTGMAFCDPVGFAQYPIPSMPASVISNITAEKAREASASVARFEEAAKSHKISFDHEVIMHRLPRSAEAFAVKARRSDLSIVQQTENHEDDNEAMIEAVLFDSGRPVLIVPYIQRDPFKLDHVVCCWDGSSTAARAVNDARPLLKRAKKVEILIVANEKTEDSRHQASGEGIVAHLTRHDINVTLKTLQAPDVDVGNAILSYIADQGADIMVIGGYGHSRLRQFVLGGVTRTILESMTAPVFMSH